MSSYNINYCIDIYDKYPSKDATFQRAPNSPAGPLPGALFGREIPLPASGAQSSVTH
jgi:hypothetical protein